MSNSPTICIRHLSLLALLLSTNHSLFRFSQAGPTVSASPGTIALFFPLIFCFFFSFFSDFLPRSSSFTYAFVRRPCYWFFFPLDFRILPTVPVWGGREYPPKFLFWFIFDLTPLSFHKGGCSGTVSKPGASFPRDYAYSGLSALSAFSLRRFSPFSPFAWWFRSAHDPFRRFSLDFSLLRAPVPPLSPPCLL